ncbi:hypothetical protein AB0L06_09560 [Spirillospora sp. NPDC052269]
MTITTERVVATAAHDTKGLISPDLFARLVARIVRDEQVSVEHAERVMVQTLGFLRACALNPEARLSPSEAVDVGWHTFILHTREYAAFCQQVAGRFIHHRPTSEQDVCDGKASCKSEAIGATVAAMRAAGISVDTELWNPAANCSQCHAGCHDSPQPEDAA